MKVDLPALRERCQRALAATASDGPDPSQSHASRALAKLAQGDPSAAAAILGELPELSRYGALQLVEWLALEDGLDPKERDRLRCEVLTLLAPNSFRARHLSRSWLEAWTRKVGFQLGAQAFGLNADWGPSSRMFSWAVEALCAAGRAAEALPFAERLGPRDLRERAEAFAAIGLALDPQEAGEARAAALERAARAGNARPMIQEGAEEVEAHGAAISAFAAGGLAADHPAVQVALKGALRLAKKRARKDARAFGFNLGAVGAARRARASRDPAWLEVAGRLRAGIHDAEHAFACELQCAFAERALGRTEEAAARLAALPDAAFGAAALREAPEEVLEKLWERGGEAWAVLSAIKEQGADPTPFLDDLVNRARRVNGPERRLLEAEGHAGFSRPAPDLGTTQADWDLLQAAKSARAAGDLTLAREHLLAGGVRAIVRTGLGDWGELFDPSLTRVRLEEALASEWPEDRWREGWALIGVLLGEEERSQALGCFAELAADSSARPERRTYSGRVVIRYPEERVQLRSQASFAGDFAAALKAAGKELNRLLDLAREVEGDPKLGAKVVVKLRKATSGRELSDRARKQAAILHGQLLQGDLPGALETLAGCPSSHYWDGVASGVVLVAEWLSGRDEGAAPEEVEALATQLGRLHPQALAPALSGAVPHLLGCAQDPDACEARLRRAARGLKCEGDLALLEAGLGHGWALRDQGERAQERLTRATTLMAEPAYYMDRNGLAIVRAIFRAHALTPLSNKDALVREAMVAYASQPNLGPVGAIARLEWAGAQLWELDDVTSLPALVLSERLGAEVRAGVRDSLLVDSAELAPRPIDAALAIFDDAPPSEEVAHLQITCLADALEKEGHDPAPLRALL